MLHRGRRVSRASSNLACLVVVVLACACGAPPRVADDWIRDLQTQGIEANRHDVVRWGADPDRYVSWHDHTNRLVPVYTFGTRGGGSGIDLDSYIGANSVYRDSARLERLYGRLPQATHDPEAVYLDNTDLARLQRAAVAAGRRHIFVVLFDGMDWQTARAAAIHRAGDVTYDAGKGSGLHFQDYTAGETAQFGLAVTAPTDDRTRGRPDTQEVFDSGDGLYGGYDPEQAGSVPWVTGTRADYVTAGSHGGPTVHAVVDSAAAATAIFAGVKTFNGAVNVDFDGRQLSTVAGEMQVEGFAVGIVTSVPISHASLASVYAHNVTRYDYQDLTRDLLGLPSASHPDRPLPGVDVLIGCGHGVERAEDPRQGSNFVAGNRYLVDEDLRTIDKAHGGSYVVALRSEGVNGAERLAAAAQEAMLSSKRLLGFYGTPYDSGHLPYRTADGDYEPAPGYSEPLEVYSEADLTENPTLAEMTAAALTVLSANERGFWLMMEAGDVDWANHDANLDNSIGAVISGDEAVRVITDWVEANSDWDESLLILMADHAHYLVLEDPRGLLGPSR
jgi:alkaline phosphatase